VRPAVRLSGERGADGLHSGVDDGFGERVRADMIVDRGVVQFGQRAADPQAELVLEFETGSGRREPDQLRDHGLGRRRGAGRSAVVQLLPVLGEPRHRGDQVSPLVAGSTMQYGRLRPGLSARLAGLLALPRYRHRDRIVQRANGKVADEAQCHSSFGRAGIRMAAPTRVQRLPPAGTPTLLLLLGEHDLAALANRREGGDDERRHGQAQ
jgi:hypothetical protein